MNISCIDKKFRNPIDEGLAFRNYVNRFGWGSVSELAQKISKSPSYNSKRIRLVEMPSNVIDLIYKSEINVSVVKELLSVANKKNQSKLALIIREKKLSSRRARRLIKENMDPSFLTYDNHNIYARKRIIKSFYKSIIALRIAIKRLGPIVEGLEDDWIFYDNISGMYAARGVWLLLNFSHENVWMLDGGFAKWKKERYFNRIQK